MLSLFFPDFPHSYIYIYSEAYESVGKMFSEHFNYQIPDSAHTRTQVLVHYTH